MRRGRTVATRPAMIGGEQDEPKTGRQAPEDAQGEDEDGRNRPSFQHVNPGKGSRRNQGLPDSV